MKKIKKADLRLEKEVISALTENDLSGVKGGINTNTVSQQFQPADCEGTGTLPPIKPSKNGNICIATATCAQSCNLPNGCQLYSVQEGCKPWSEANCFIKWTEQC